MTKFVHANNLVYDYSHGDSEALSQWDRDRISSQNVDIAIYSYYSGSYEGSGDIICLKNGKWYHFDMSHCSCNGPLDSFDSGINDETLGKDTLVELLDNFSEEYRATVFMLVSAYEAQLDLEQTENTEEQKS